MLVERRPVNFKLFIILVYNTTYSKTFFLENKMAQFSIEIADADVNRVLGSVAANYGRPDKIPNPDYDHDATVPNPDYDPSIPEDAITNPSVIPDTSVPESIDNPETIPQFVNRIVREFLAENVKAYEIRVAKEAAAAAADTNVDISDPQL